jgi:hypothetical protein
MGIELTVADDVPQGQMHEVRRQLERLEKIVDRPPPAQARAEEDFLNHRFLYFIDAEDNRGKVLYPRFDGDYGLVEPA